jgi:hypothetical protein
MTRNKNSSKPIQKKKDLIKSITRPQKPITRRSPRITSTNWDDRLDPQKKREELSAFATALISALGEEPVVTALTGKTWEMYNPKKKYEKYKVTKVLFKCRSKCTSNLMTGHFVGCHKGTIYDSADYNWQEWGSDGFCQTFAIITTIKHVPEFYQLMNLKDLKGPKQGKYVAAAKIALKFIHKNAKYVHDAWKFYLSKEKDAYDLACYVPSLSFEYFKKRIWEISKNRDEIIDVLNLGDHPPKCKTMDVN